MIVVCSWDHACSWILTSIKKKSNMESCKKELSCSISGVAYMCNVLGVGRPRWQGAASSNRPNPCMHHGHCFCGCGFITIHTVQSDHNLRRFPSDTSTCAYVRRKTNLKPFVQQWNNSRGICQIWFLRGFCIATDRPGPHAASPNASDPPPTQEN